MLEHIGREIRQVQNRFAQVATADSVQSVAAAMDYEYSLGGTVASEGTVLIIRSGQERRASLHACVDGGIG